MYMLKYFMIKKNTHKTDQLFRATLALCFQVYQWNPFHNTIWLPKKICFEVALSWSPLIGKTSISLLIYLSKQAAVVDEVDGRFQTVECNYHMRFQFVCIYSAAGHACCITFQHWKTERMCVLVCRFLHYLHSSQSYGASNYFRGIQNLSESLHSDHFGQNRNSLSVVFYHGIRPWYRPCPKKHRKISTHIFKIDYQ